MADELNKFLEEWKSHLKQSSSSSSSRRQNQLHQQQQLQQNGEKLSLPSTATIFDPDAPEEEEDDHDDDPFYKIGEADDDDDDDNGVRTSATVLQRDDNEESKSKSRKIDTTAATIKFDFSSSFSSFSSSSSYQQFFNSKSHKTQSQQQQQRQQQQQQQQHQSKPNIKPKINYLQLLIKDIDEDQDVPFLEYVLPREVARLIFSFLEVFEILRCEQVCKSFRELVNDNELWKRICEKENLPIEKRKPGQDFRNFYTTTIFRAKEIDSRWKELQAAYHSLNEKPRKGMRLTTMHVQNNKMITGYSNGRVQVHDLTPPQQRSSVYPRYDTENSSISSITQDKNLIVCGDTLGLIEIIDLNNSGAGTGTGANIPRKHKNQTAVSTPSSSSSTSSTSTSTSASSSSNVPVQFMATDADPVVYFTAVSASLEKVCFATTNSLYLIGKDFESANQNLSAQSLSSIHKTSNNKFNNNVNHDDDCSSGWVLQKQESYSDDPIYNLLFLPTALAVQTKYEVKICNPTTLQPTMILQEARELNECSNLKLQQNTLMFCVRGLNSLIHLYHIESNASSILLQRDGAPNCIDYSEPNILMTGTHFGTSIFDLRTQKKVSSLGRYDGSVTAIEYNDWKIATGLVSSSGSYDTNYTVAIWDRRMNKKLWFIKHKAQIQQVRVTNEYLLYSSETSTASFYVDGYTPWVESSIGYLDFAATPSELALHECPFSSKYDDVSGYNYNIRLAVPYDDDFDPYALH